MAYVTSKKHLALWRENLNFLQSGAKKSGFALRDDLQKTADELLSRFDGQVLNYNNLSARQAQERRQAQTIKNTALLLLNKAYGALVSSTFNDDRRYALQLYNLQDKSTTSRNKILALLHHIISVVGQQQEDKYKLPDALFQEIKTKTEALDQHMNAILQLRTEMATQREAISRTVQDARELRERIYGFLSASLEKGRRDPVLQDFGFSFKQSRRSAVKVTVVDDVGVDVDAPQPAAPQ